MNITFLTLLLAILIWDSGCSSKNGDKKNSNEPPKTEAKVEEKSKVPSEQKTPTLTEDGEKANTGNTTQSPNDEDTTNSSESNSPRSVAISTLILSRPQEFNGTDCNHTVFSGPLTDLLENPVSNPTATASIDNIIHDRTGQHSELTIAINGLGVRLASLAIQGKTASMELLKLKIDQGSPIKMSEFKQCAATDSDVILIEHVTFASLKSLHDIKLSSAVEILKKDSSGRCQVNQRSVLGEMVLKANPFIDLNDVTVNLIVSPNGRNAETGALISKRLTISFSRKIGSTSTGLSSPKLTIETLADLSYVAIDRMSVENGVLTMTGDRECLGDTPDDPLLILGGSFQ